MKNNSTKSIVNPNKSYTFATSNNERNTMKTQQVNEIRRRNALLGLCVSVSIFLVGAITATALPFIVGLVSTPLTALLLWGCEVNNE